MITDRVWEQVSFPHIYMIINHITNKKYIGQHSGKLINYKAGGTIINKSFKKHGINNFSRIILEFWLEPPFNLDDIESNYINLYNTVVPNGYNISINGTGRFNYDRKPWNKGGGEYSDETRLKMRNSKLGVILPETHKNKISQSMLGKSKTSEHTMNIRIGGSKKAVLQYDLNDNFIKEHINCAFAAEELNCTREAIRDACNGRMKKCKNFKWKYKSN